MVRALVTKRKKKFLWHWLLLYTGPFGIGIMLCGTVFVNRASSEAGRAAINAAGKRAKQSGTS
jgi:hypothetical protein